MIRLKLAFPVALLGATLMARPQAPAPPQAPASAADAPAQTQQPAIPPTPNATVLFERSIPLDPDAPETTQAPKTTAVSSSIASPEPDDDPLHVTAVEREALTVTAYDLDLRLTPMSAGLSARARLTLRNDSPAPLTRIVLQISSSLHWDTISTPAPAAKLAFTVRRIPTDADHTGYAQEAVIALAQPLAPGASVALTALYSGAIPPSAERLERIGVPSAEARFADWDAIAAPTADDPEAGTGLRGFGNVLWYPVAAEPVFLGDGAKLFQAVGRSRLREQAASIRLHLAVEFTGDPPDAAFFCGRRGSFTVLRDDPSLPVAESSGIASADFPSALLGFRTPSLFVTPHAPAQVDASAASSSSAPEIGLIAAVTGHYDALPSYSSAAALVRPLLVDWFGAQPLSQLHLLDRNGQPFEDGALLVRPVRIEQPTDLAPSLVHSLTHAWIHSSHPWIDEGLAQFATLLWTERTQGRAAAIAQLQEANRSLALAEPAPAPAGSAGPSDNASSSNPGATVSASEGQPLLAAATDTFYRTKAASVFWMLRGLTGDDALKQALQAYRAATEADPAFDRDPEAFERTLEKASHQDLRWFFHDWVYGDPGLPDLSIANVTPRQLEARGGASAGWLVAVDVRNDGDAEAEVPLTVSAAPRGTAQAATETQRLRVPAHSTVSRRIVFASTPDQVQVNDGTVPEAGATSHLRKLVMPGQ